MSRAIMVSGVRRLTAGALMLSAAGLASLALHEGGSLRTVYLDPVGIPTVCMGTTEGLTKADVGKRYTAEMCEARNRASLRTAEAAVKRLVKTPITQGQYDSLVSFVFNVGEGNLAASTLLRKLNAGQCTAAAAEFPRWNRAGGKVLKGLTTRRAEERAVFEKDCWDGVGSTSRIG